MRTTARLYVKKDEISEKLRSVIAMDERKADVINRIRAYGIIKDPQWLDRPDELVPLWVMLEAFLELINRLDPPNQPFD